MGGGRAEISDFNRFLTEFYQILTKIVIFLKNYFNFFSALRWGEAGQRFPMLDLGRVEATLEIERVLLQGFMMKMMSPIEKSSKY